MTAGPARMHLHEEGRLGMKTAKKGPLRAVQRARIAGLLIYAWNTGASPAQELERTARDARG
jgi:hypothetical protein